MINLEIVLTKVSAYANEIECHRLSQILSLAESAFGSALLPADVTYTHPTRVAALLAEWCLPTPLIEVAVWSVAKPNGRRLDFIEQLDEQQGRLAYQLFQFYRFFNEVRAKQISNPDKQIETTFNAQLLGKFLPPGFVVLLVAIFLETMRTCAYNPNAPDKKQLALQARTIFEEVISERLGLWLVRRELKDLIFLCEEPERYAEVHHLAPPEQTMALFVEKIIWQVQNVVRNYDIPSWQWECLPTPPYKMNKLLQQRHTTRLGPHDMFSIIILLPCEELCYKFLQPLHKIGGIKTSFRDYTKLKNGYRSIHAYIPMNRAGTVTFHLRTTEWNNENNYGILDHWRNNKIPSIEDIMLKPPDGEIFVYKDGKVYVLPEGSTPTTLAYHISKHLGEACIGAYVYGKGIIDAKQSLEDGDIVDLNLRYYTPSSPTDQTQNERTIQQESTELIKKSSPGRPGSTIEEIDITDFIHITSAPYIDKRCYQCDRCKPYPPLPIVAYLTTNDTLTIHQPHCRAIPERDLTRPVLWRTYANKPGSILLTIKSWDHIGLLADITRKISDLNINITKLDAEIQKDGTTLFRLVLQNVDQNAQSNLQNGLYEIKRIRKIELIYIGRDDERIPGTSATTLINCYTPQPADETIFIGRKREVQKIWKILGEPGGSYRNSVLVWGQQRIGKTSLLYHLKTQILEDRHPIFIPVQLTTTSWEQSVDISYSDILYNFAHQLKSELDLSFSFITTNLPQQHEQQWRDPWTLMDYFQSIFQKMKQGQRLLIMLDEFQDIFHKSPAQSQPLVKCLCSLLSSPVPVSFIFAGWGLLSGNELFQQVRALTFLQPLSVLDPQDAKELIQNPVSPRRYDADIVEQILTLTNCHPYYIHLLCSNIVEGLMEEPGRMVITQDDLTQAVAKMMKGDESPFFYILKAERDGDIVLEQFACLAHGSDHYLRTESFLQSLKKRVPEERILKILRNLTALEILEQSEQDKDIYRIRLPLLHQWLQKNKLY